MEEPAEIAVLTSEYILSALLLTALDNLPLEISHILREVELKDAKVKGVFATLTQRLCLESPRARRKCARCTGRLTR